MKDLNHIKTLPMRNKFFQIFVCMLVLAVSFFGMTKLAGSKKPPVEAKIEERSLQVEANRMEPVDYPIVITGYGEVHALKEVTISPEVSGTLVGIHPRLHTGEIIPRGEVLFRIDSRNYETTIKEARASVTQWENAIKRLKKQNAINKQRLKTMERNQELAKLEFKRLLSLYQNDKVGTRSGVEKAERAFNVTVDQVAQMNQALAILPLQIKEAQSSLTSAKARLTIAQVNFDRCTISADFDARVKSVSIERGQYVSPSHKALSLADDSTLEILVSLDSRDARKWLQFNGDHRKCNTSWFTLLEPVRCNISWTEDSQNHTWKGQLHRVVRFNKQTRTITVAVRIDSADATGNGTGGLPLVEGMFCSVQIPGKILKNVYRLPSWAVSYKNTVYTVHNNRLKTVPVKVERVEGDTTIVSDGLRPGDLIISTRLADPLENILLEVTNLDSLRSLS